MESLTAGDLHTLLLWAYGLSSVSVFVILQFVAVAYGRHNDGERAWWWGPNWPSRASFVIMETPLTLGFALFYFLGEKALEPAPLALFLLWQAHYVHRTFIYPFRRKTAPGSTMAALVPVSSFVTNIGVAFLNASILTWISIRADYGVAWLTDPRFVLGVVVFVAGYYINRRADAILTNLRAPGESGYKIPRGWLYERVSCPNYLGELVMWTGWALASWSMAGVVFVLWSAGNLVPRALSHHRWYQEKFADYPANRRAIIPGLL